MLHKRIEAFEEKHNIDFNQLLLAFEAGATRLELTEQFNVTELPLRKFIYSLGLEFPKNKRKESIEQFTYMLGRENGEDIQQIVELSNEVTIIAKDNLKLNKSIVLQRDNNTALRRLLRETTRESALSDTLLELFSKYLLEYGVNTKVIQVENPKVVDFTDEGLCVVFSDEHLGESVNSKVVQGNTYNYKTAKARIRHVMSEVLVFPHQSRKLNVVMLLDALKGLIHGGAYNNEDGFTTAILKLVEIYSGVFETFSLNYDEVIVHTTLDNHSRTTDHTSTSNKTDNFSVMAMQMIKLVLSTKGITNVKFNFSKGDYNFTRINTAGVCMFHGDAVRSYKAYSSSQVAKIQDFCLHHFKTPAKHFISGHQHQSIISANQYGGTNIQNGTVVGNNEYGQNGGFLPIVPNQTIFFINKNGDIETTKVVALQNVK